MSFTLCDECLTKHRALEFNPAGRPGLCNIPFNSLVWKDEHPSDLSVTRMGHEPCLLSFIALHNARKQIWSRGGPVTDIDPVWHEAQQVIPDWPGFRRTVLTDEHRQWLAQCEQETDDMMGYLRQDSAMFTVEPRGPGAIRFIAHPRDGARPGDEAIQ